LKRTKKHLIKSNLDFNRSILKKQFRFSDWFAEKVIRSVAFFSIAFVILIFLFVFRETLPIFKGNKEIAVQTTNSGGQSPDVNELKPESYSSNDEKAGQTELKPEEYSSSTDSQIVLIPESYGDLPMDINRQPSEVSTLNEYNPSVKKSENALSTLTSKDWQPVSRNPRYGLLPLIIGTLKVSLIAILFAAPLAIFAALYTAMFAPRKLREYIKPIIELLAGFPSVVIGFFALMVLASLFQNIFGYSSRLNSFVGGIAMGLAAIPIIYTLTEDALTAVPRGYIEASLGLGASIRQTAFSVILPAAVPGIFAAILLGIGRVFGETMIVLMATGNASIISANPFDSVRTLSATIGAEMAEVVFGDTHYSVLFLIGSLLFILTFAFNAFAEFYFKNKMVKRIQGK
jgi:phosphate transport system permease protein